MDSKQRSRIRARLILERLEERVVLSTVAPIHAVISHLPVHHGKYHQPAALAPTGHAHKSAIVHRAGHAHKGHGPGSATTATHTALPTNLVVFEGGELVPYLPGDPIVPMASASSSTRAVLASPVTVKVDTLTPNPATPSVPASTATSPGGKTVVNAQPFTATSSATRPTIALPPGWKGILPGLPGIKTPVTVPGPASTAPGSTGPAIVNVDPFNPAPSIPGVVNADPFTLLPLDRLGDQLSRLYRAFEQGDATQAEMEAQAMGLTIQGDSVGVGVRSSGNLGQLVSDLNALGMQIEASSSYYGLVQGLIPIARLGDLAALKDASSISPMYRPQLFA